MTRTPTLLAALVAVAALATNARAQEHRYERDEAPKAVDVDADDVRDLAEKKHAARKVETEQRPLTADDVLAIRVKQQPIRDEQIELYKDLIEDTDDEDAMEKADLLFRLADLQAQRAANLRFELMERYDDLDAATDKAEKKRVRSEIKKLERRRAASLDDAIATYEQGSHSRYQDYPGMDNLLFYYAHTLAEANEHDRAREIYHQLIVSYPGSDHVADAWSVFGDYYFAAGELANAETAYDKVLKFPKSAAYAYAMYKKGWVQLNLGDNQDALATFYRVIELTKNDAAKQRLADSAKHDFVRAFAFVGKAELALKTFERISKRDAFMMLGFLADMYVEQGKATRAIYTLRELMSEQPRHDQVCQWQYTVAELMLAEGSNYAAKADEIADLVTLYSTLAKRSSTPEQVLDECRESAATLSGTMARTWHNEGYKTRNVDILEVAARMYRAYLDAFSDHDDAVDTEYFYAELLWATAEIDTAARGATARWERAAEAFTKVVKRKKLDAKRKKVAAWGAVLSWKNALDIDPRPELPDPVETSPDEIPAKIEMPAARTKMLAAFKLYIDNVDDAKDDDLVGLKFLTGQTYARYNYFSKAVAWFEDILEHHADHPAAVDAAQLLLDSLILSQRNEDMIAWVDELATRTAFVNEHDALRRRLVTIKRLYLRKQVEQLYATAEASDDLGAFVRCGEAYFEIYQSDKEAADNAEVLFNAGVCFERGKSMGAAVQMFDALQTHYAKSSAAKRGLAHLGNIFASIAYYDIAVDKLEEYGRKYGGEDDADEALSDAVFYSKGIGDADRAIRLTDFFVAQYAKKYPDEAASALFNLTAIYEERGDAATLIKHLQRYLDTFGKTGGIDRRIVAYSKLGLAQWQRSCPVPGVNGACVEVTRERSVAQARAAAHASGVSQQQCGPDTKIKVRVHERNARNVKAARAAFGKAISLWDDGKALASIAGDGDGGGGTKSQIEAATKRSVASSFFHLAEQQYESFLSLEFPTGLDFDKRRASVRTKSLARFKGWFTKRTDRGVEANAAYKEIVDSQLDAHYAIASAARIGQISQNFAHTLYTAEIPRDVRTGQWAEDKIMNYCEELENQALPLETASLAAFEVCLETSTKLSWFNEWSQLCEHELGQMRPEAYPTASEIHTAPTKLAPIIDTEPPVLALAVEPHGAPR